MKHPELLIPASSLEVLKTAVVFGADAVYIGGEAFGLRAKAKNFSMEEIREGIAFAHAHDVKVYITANILAHNGDLSGVRAYFEELKEIKPDALIISDPGVFMIAREVCPEIDIHISTQANNTNYGTYQFWHQLGARRVVTARELSMAELKEIREKAPADLEMETFIHGAMCISYSGRCLLSNYFTGRDANQGACTHPCRWKYSIVEETRPNEYMPVYENERGTHQIFFGIGKHRNCLFPEYRQLCVSSATWCDRDTLYICSQLTDELVAAIHFKLVFSENGTLTLMMKKQRKPNLNEFQGVLTASL